LRPDIVFNAQRLDTLAQGLLLAHSSIALGLDLSLALAVGSLCFFEDADNMLALWGSLVTFVSYRQSSAPTLLTTFPDLLMTVMVSPTPMATSCVEGCPAAALRRWDGVVQRLMCNGGARST